MKERIPCLIHVDEHVLVVAKPAGINTHRPSPHAPLGMYEWLKMHLPELDALSILHRLDKDTSGVLVMGRTREANRSITAQFENRTVTKRYVLVTTGDAGDTSATEVPLRWANGQSHVDEHGDPAFTRFERIRKDGERSWYAAFPSTGRSHQIRVHAAALGIPILGDELYGGEAADRVHLHAESLTLTHPETDQPVTWTAKTDFQTPPAVTLRTALLPIATCTYHRVLHGAADGVPGLFADRLGDHLVAHTESPLSDSKREQLETVRNSMGLSQIHHRHHDRHVGTTGTQDLSPRPLDGGDTPDSITVTENDLQWLLRLDSGYSHGLFADQRENRWRVLHNRIAPGVPIRAGGLEGARVLNTFAYTCAFSACAAAAGAHATSIDLSARWLDWGRLNFTLNGLDPEEHLFLKGDALQWLPRLQRQGKRHDLVILDPPTFARMKGKRTFRAERDFGDLIALAAPLVAPDGWILASTNAQRIRPEAFEEMARETLAKSGHPLEELHFTTQPPDFPAHPDQPLHLKTLWLRLGASRSEKS